MNVESWREVHDSSHSVALTATVETDVLGAVGTNQTISGSSGVDMTETDRVSVILKNLDAANPISTITLYVIGPGGLAQAYSSNYGPLASGAQTLIEWTKVGAPSRMRLTCTSTLGVSGVQVDARGERTS